MAFTYRIVKIYGELAEERIAELQGGGADAGTARRCFADFERLLGNGIPDAAGRRELKALLASTIRPALPSIRDAGLRAFVRFAVDYIHSRIIDVPRYIYVPWPAVEAGELMRWAQSWKNFATGQGKTFEIVSQDIGRGAFERIHPLGQIYVLGHGSPGATVLVKSSEAVDVSKLGMQDAARLTKQRLAPVNFTLLASQLEATGLPASFAGSLKIYACSGGVSGGPSTSPLVPQSLGSTSFVKLFATHMRAKGYTACEMVGYLEDLAAPTMFEMAGARTVALADELKGMVSRLAKMSAMLAVTPEMSDAEILQQIDKAYRETLRELKLPRAQSVAKRF